MKPLRVLFLCSEAVPLVKVGGLGDVAGSLPGALRALPSRPDVRVCIPYYKSIKKMDLDLIPAASFVISHRDGPMQAEVFQGMVNGVPYYFIDGSPIASSYDVYSGDNYQDGVKFTFFSLAALELARVLKWNPDIVHAHDWHTALLPTFIDEYSLEDKNFSNIKTLFTIHNLANQGISSLDIVFGEVDR